MKKIMISILALLMSASVYGTNQIDPIIEEARIKAASGDLESATALYHQAIKQDSENTALRRELANVLIEANIREPHAESLDVMEVIEKGA